MRKATQRQPDPAYTLPEGWSEGEVLADEVEIDGLRIRRVGLTAAGPQGTHATGAAAAVDQDPLPRARFELMERAAAFESLREGRPSHPIRDGSGRPVGWIESTVVLVASDAPAAWQPARSNGVALHRDFARAAERAAWELAERDAILRAWFGRSRPTIISRSPPSAHLGRTTGYGFIVALFPALDAPWSRELSIAGVFGFPRDVSSPLVLGYAARPSVEEAVSAASSECLQQLAFLWGEEIPTAAPAPGPTALHHLEHWLYPEAHAVLRDWLQDGHPRYRMPYDALESDAAVQADAAVHFIDVTPAQYRPEFAVVRAISEATFPLHFGLSPLTEGLPGELRNHPIS